MTQRLQQALVEVQKLPAQEQDAIASLILDEIADEWRWEETIARSQNQLTRLAAKAGECAHVPVTALAKFVECDDTMMQVTFTDGRVLGMPLAWFPTLRKATPEQRARYEIGGGGISLHWPELDEDLSLAGLMAGVDGRSG